MSDEADCLPPCVLLFWLNTYVADYSNSDVRNWGNSFMSLFSLQSHLRFDFGHAVGEVHTGCCLRNRFPPSRNAPSHAVVESGVVLEFFLALIVNAVKPTVVEFPSFLKIKLCKRDATKRVNVRGMGGKCLFIVNWDVNWQKKLRTSSEQIQ